MGCSSSTQAAAAAVANACLNILFLVFGEERWNQGMDVECGFDEFVWTVNKCCTNV